MAYTAFRSYGNVIKSYVGDAHILRRNRLFTSSRNSIFVRSCDTAAFISRCHRTIRANRVNEFSVPFSTTPSSSAGDPSFYILPVFKDIQTDLKKGQRIVAFGDIHGDIKACTEFLITAKVMDPESTIEKPKWIGNDTIAIQLGDVLDRGNSELSCLRLLTSLSRQAKEEGGALLLLHGNHEALNANGLFQYAFPGGNKEIDATFGAELDSRRGNGTQTWRLQYAGNQPSRWAIFEPGGYLSEPLMMKMKVATVIGHSCFVHGGLTKEHLKQYGGIQGMNQQCREWFNSPIATELQNDDATKFRSVEDVIQNASLRAKTVSKSMPECLGGGIGSKSPVWLRDFSSPADTSPELSAQNLMNDCLKELSVQHDFPIKRMVMGHTPQKQINAALQGTAWRADIGASAGVLARGGREVLQIIHEGAENSIDDLVEVLTFEGQSIPSSERQVLSRDSLFFN